MVVDCIALEELLDMGQLQSLLLVFQIYMDNGYGFNSRCTYVNVPYLFQECSR